MHVSFLHGDGLLHRGSYKGLAPPRQQQTEEQLQSTQTTVDRQHAQMKHRTPPQNQLSPLDNPSQGAYSHPAHTSNAPGPHYTDLAGPKSESAR